MKLCMIGTGYVGLVSGVCFADIGNQVICVDKDKNKIEKLNSGISPIYEPGLDELIKKNFTAKRLSFTTDIDKAISISDIIFICVGTPTKKGYFQIKDVVEKPSIKKAPSNFAIIGRYILPIKIFREIKKLKPGQDGEIHITDAIRSLIKKEDKFYGNIFMGKYLDCGTLSGYINSEIQISKRK